MTPIFKNILKKLFRFRRVVIYTRRLDQDLPRPPATDSVFCRAVTLEDLFQFENVIDVSKLPAMEERLKKGRICFGAFVDGKMVSFHWASLENEYDVHADIEIEVCPGEVYVYHSLTHPDFRNQGISTILETKLFEYLYETGLKKALAYIDLKNFQSLSVASKLGYSPEKMLYIFDLLGFKIKFKKRLN